jgi:CyaY protein
LRWQSQSSIIPGRGALPSDKPLSHTIITGAAMAEISYSVRASQMLENILEQMEAESACDDIDMDMVDGVLKIVFEDGGQIIINRQEPLEQLWVASPLGPAHFSFDTERELWVDAKNGSTLMETLSQALTLKLGETVTLRD